MIPEAWVVTVHENCFVSQTMLKSMLVLILDDFRIAYQTEQQQTGNSEGLAIIKMPLVMWRRKLKLSRPIQSENAEKSETWHTLYLRKSAGTILYVSSKLMFLPMQVLDPAPNENM